MLCSEPDAGKRSSSLDYILSKKESGNTITCPAAIGELELCQKQACAGQDAQGNIKRIKEQESQPF